MVADGAQHPDPALARPPRRDRPGRRAGAQPHDPASPAHPLGSSGGLYRSIRQPVPRGRGALRDGSAAGGEAPGAADWYPGLESGLRTMAFVEAVLESAKSQEKWTAFPATGLVTQPF